jgi:hypothetical protein
MEKETLLHRQVHPLFVQANQVSIQTFSVTSQVFKPTPKDDKRLSVYNGDKFSAEDAFLHYSNEGHSSVGVLSVCVGECITAGLTTSEDNIPFDGHAHIDFTGLGNNTIEKKAKILRNNEVQRGWQYGPI